MTAAFSCIHTSPAHFFAFLPAKPPSLNSGGFSTREVQESSGHPRQCTNQAASPSNCRKSKSPQNKEVKKHTRRMQLQVRKTMAPSWTYKPNRGKQIFLPEKYTQCYHAALPYCSDIIMWSNKFREEQWESALVWTQHKGMVDLRAPACGGTGTSGLQRGQPKIHLWQGSLSLQRENTSK